MARRIRQRVSEEISNTDEGASWSRTNLTNGGFTMDNNGEYGQSSQYRTTAATMKVENPTYGYSLKYKGNCIGVYASFSVEAGKWSLVTGLRGEYTRTDDRSGRLQRSYSDLFPNLSTTYAFDRMKKWMLVGQYTQNIERPAFYALNPNRLQTSDYSYQIGNPYLRPTYINRFSATLVYNYRYTLTVGGNLHRDLIREFCKQDAGNPDISMPIRLTADTKAPLQGGLSKYP